MNWVKRVETCGKRLLWSLWILSFYIFKFEILLKNQSDFNMHFTPIHLKVSYFITPLSILSLSICFHFSDFLAGFYRNELNSEFVVSILQTNGFILNRLSIKSRYRYIHETHDDAPKLELAVIDDTKMELIFLS